MTIKLCDMGRLSIPIGAPYFVWDSKDSNPLRQWALFRRVSGEKRKVGDRLLVSWDGELPDWEDLDTSHWQTGRYRGWITTEDEVTAAEIVARIGRCETWVRFCLNAYARFDAARRAR